MKGVVFTEFLDMVEQAHSAAVVDDLIAACDLPSKGAYSSVGTYDHGEIVQLVGALSRHTGVPVPQLVSAFGEHLFGRFLITHPQLFAGSTTTFDFLSSVHEYVHREVLKLYPDAQLPHFETRRVMPDTLLMTYRSPRGMEDLAEGLIRATAAHFGTTLTLTREVIRDAAGSAVRFTLQQAA